MALIIRKFENGNKIKKFENPAELLDFTALSMLGDSNTSISGSTTNNTELDFTAQGIAGDTTPKNIVFKFNDEVLNIDLLTIKKALDKVQDRTLANKQLNLKESAIANEWLLKLIESAKEVNLTNKGIYIDGVLISKPRDFYEGIDGKLMKKYAKDYAADTLLRQLGIIKTASNNTLRADSYYGDGRSPFDLPTINITKPEEPEETEESLAQLAIDDFNKAYNTIGKPWQNEYLKSASVYAFNTQDPTKIVLAKKDNDGNYIKADLDRDILFYDDEVINDPLSPLGHAIVKYNGEYYKVDPSFTGNDSVKRTYDTLLSTLSDTSKKLYKGLVDQWNNIELYNKNFNNYRSRKDYFDATYQFSNKKPIILNYTKATHNLYGKLDFQNVPGVVKDGNDYKEGMITKKDGKYFFITNDKTVINLGYLTSLDASTPSNYVLKKFVTVDYSNSSNISDDSINTIIQNIENPQNSIDKRRKAYAELLKYYYNKVQNNPSFDRAKALSIILTLLDENVLRLLSQPVTQKLGGSIKKLQEGGYLRFLESLNKELNSVELDLNQYSFTLTPNEYKGQKELITLNNSLEGNNKLRTAAVGLDAISLFGGVGGAISGLVATALEGFADLTDDNVSKSDALKNLAVNLGFSLLAIVPGMASAKIAKSATKGGVKLAKSLNKLKGVVETSDDLKDVSKILDKANDTITFKDAKNIISKSKELLGAAKNTGDDSVKAAIDVLNTCETLLETGKLSKTVATVGNIANTGFSAYGLYRGLPATVNVIDKVVEGDLENINLQEIQDVLAGIGGYKGAKQSFKNYAIKKGIVDVDTPTTNTSSKRVTLKAGDDEITLDVSSKDKVDVRNKLNAERQKLENSKTGKTEDEINSINKDIEKYDRILNDFDNVYKANVSKFSDAIKSTKEKASKLFGWVEPYDYSNKKLIDNTEDLSWILRKGRLYAEQEGFTEDGFDIFKSPRFIERFKEEKIKSKEKPKEKISTESTSTTTSSTPETTSTTKTLVSNAIENILKKSSRNQVNKVLSTLKNKGITNEEKTSLKESIDKLKSKLNVNQLNALKKYIDSLKKGGSVKVKKFEGGNPVEKDKTKTTSTTVTSSAESSAEDPTGTGSTTTGTGSLVYNPDDFIENSNDADINKRKFKFGVIPEHLNILAKTANSWVGTNKIMDILQNKEAAKLEYPYIHIPVLEDLASYQHLKNTINEGRANLNTNLTSDASLQKATNLEYNKQALESIGKLNALRSQDLGSQRLKSINQEFINEQNRVDTANKNNQIDVSLADYKRGLEALKISSLTSIINTNLELTGLLFNRMMDKANKLQFAKEKDRLNQLYFDKSNYDNYYVTNYDTYDKSSVKQYETALGVDKDTIIKQDKVDDLYNRWVAENPTKTDEEKQQFRENINQFVGTTLLKYYEKAYRYHENNLNNITRSYTSKLGLIDSYADASKYFLTGNTFRGVPYYFKKGGSFKETKYKTDAKSKDVHNKLALEYAKLIHKQHQENIKNSLPFLLHSYKNTTKV